MKVGQNLSSFTVLDTHSGEELPVLPSVQKHRRLSLVLCKDLDGWDASEVGGRSKREDINADIQLSHFIVQQKLTTLLSNYTSIERKQMIIKKKR